MEKQYLEIIKIILENNLEVELKKLNEYKEQSPMFYRFLFESIHDDDIDTLIYHMLYLEDINIDESIMPNFEIILKKLANKLSFLNICLKKLKSTEFLFKNEKIIKDSLDLHDYSYFFTTLMCNDKIFAKRYQADYKLLYEFRDALNSKKDIRTYYFEMDILIPIIRANIYEYLNYVVPKVFKSKKLNIDFLDSGSSSFAFAVNDLVLRLGDARAGFEIINHYRINEFIVRKKILTDHEPIYIDICPKGNLKKVTDKDREDALYDLKEAGIIVTDTHYSQNFALVDYVIPDNMFRDVDGIIEHRQKSLSYSFKRKPVKLIDQDYIYDINDPKKKWVK